MSTDISTLPEGYLDAFELVRDVAVGVQPAGPGSMLSALPMGARLILRCRKDWRDATVVGVSLTHITLSVGAPSGRTYRVRRPPDTPLAYDGARPVLGDGSWRAGFARYDVRW